MMRKLLYSFLFFISNSSEKTFKPGLGLICIGMFLVFNFGLAQTTATFNTSGIFTVPAGVTSITVECWGGGGAGGGGASTTGAAGGGGGGGSYTKSTITVVPNSPINYTVGAGGTGGTGDGGNGFTTTFSTVSAIGGNGGKRGASTAGAGGTGGVGITYSGGDGRNGVGGSGGGGGSSAGTGVGGNNAPAAPAGASAVPEGGAGGSGGVSNIFFGAEWGNDGDNGGAPGGGGGGAYRGWYGNLSGGNGGNGQIRITYCRPFSISSLSNNGPICASNGSAIITVSSTAAGLPVGNYTVTYNTSTGSGFTTGMNVNPAGRGTFTVNGLTTGGTSTVTVTGLASETCSTTGLTNTTNVTITAVPTISYSGSPFCRSTTTPQSVTRTGVAGGTYSSTAGLSIIGSTGEITPSTSAAGTYTVTYNYPASNGCPIGSVTTSVTVNNLPTANPGGTLAAICQGTTSTQMGGSIGGGATGGIWSGGTGTWSNPTNPSTATYTAGASESGNIVLTLTASNSSCANVSVTKTIMVNPIVGTPVFADGASSVRCQGVGSVTYGASATNSTAITYSLDTASSSGGNTINSSTGAVSYVAGWSGTTTITASAAGCNGPRTATHTVTVTPTVGAPVFSIGATSTRCQGSGSVTYTASATNSTAITYSLDTASSSGGNTINSSTGAVSYVAGWSGTTTITASAAGCNGPRTATHTVTVTPTVGAPVFSIGATSMRCQGSGSVTYTASATNSTAITYSLDTASSSGGNTINSSTGAVSYVAGWSGTTTITASAAGCNGPVTSTHTVTVTPTVGTPVFAIGATSTRCQGSGSVTYTASATNSTAITYSLDTASSSGGNTINSSTGAISYVAGWSGTTTITASAAGCNGPRTAAHTVTVTPTVGAPVFSIGATSMRCQGSGSVTYTASATNSTAITYSLDTASSSEGNTINSSTGAVSYVAGWSGTTTITASAAGCNGPRTATHTITVTPTVGAPVFSIGATSMRCQGSGSVTYTASATNSTAITYSLDTASSSGGNTINSSTGAVSYVAGWSGTTTITASAAGCNGPVTSTHTVTVTPTVGTPVFVIGATSTRCQGSGSVTYTASATNSTAITYSLDTASSSGGNTINSSTGAVSYVAGWSGTTTITASAAGCNGPKTAAHTVTVTPTVGTPVFAIGATSTRCQGSGSVTYTASATNSTGITYSLDTASSSGGNTIDSSTGSVSYVTGWSGTTTITASAAGCNGPVTSTHIVTVTPTSTIARTSTVGTDLQTVCVNSSITNITYVTTGATGANFNGLPAGINGDWTGNIITISGTPTTFANSPFNYEITLIGGCGNITTSGTITVNPRETAPSIGTITDVSCLGAGSVVLENLPSGTWYIDRTGLTTLPHSFSGTGPLTTVSGLAADTYHFTVRTDDTCVSAQSSAVEIKDGSSTEWTSTGWSNGPPTSSKSVTISSTNGSPFATDTEACSLTINVPNGDGDPVVTVPAGVTLTITNAVTSNGKLVFESGASLMQGATAQNSGEIVYKRTTSVRRYDLTYWSMPVTKVGFKMKDLSPDTLGDKYFYYDPVAADWIIDYNGATHNMELGRGYNIRGPQTNDITTPSDFTAVFKGTPNNGNYAPAVVAGAWNLIGNPYPSAISADTFLGNNAGIGTLYFWAHTNLPVNNGTDKYYSYNDDFIAYNSLGSNGDFDGYITAAQGFFVKIPATTTALNYNNDQREAGKNTKFFKTAKSSIEKHRMWVKITNTTGDVKQILVGYAQGATNTTDVDFDAVSMASSGSLDFYSINNAKKLVIQARALPFVKSDIITFGYMVATKGEYTFSIDHADGMFNEGQEVFLQDKTTGKITNLRLANYKFTSEAGTFNSRFVIRYVDTTLGTDDFDSLENSVLVSVKNRVIKIASSKESVKEVNIYDIGAQLLYNKNNVNSSELQISNLHSSDQALLVKITLENGHTFTKKIIFSNL